MEKIKAKDSKKKHGDDSGDSSEEGGDVVAELNVETKKSLTKNIRTSVSAEVFGKYHIK